MLGRHNDSVVLCTGGSCNRAALAYKVLGSEGPQGCCLPLLGVPCAPVVHEHHAKDMLACRFCADWPAQLIATANESCLAHTMHRAHSAVHAWINGSCCSFAAFMPDALLLYHDRCAPTLVMMAARRAEHLGLLIACTILCVGTDASRQQSGKQLALMLYCPACPTTMAIQPDFSRCAVCCKVIPWCQMSVTQEG